MGKWIGEFKPHKGVVCPGFHRLAYLAKCPHGCAYCYLNGTYSRFGFPADMDECDLPSLTYEVERWLSADICSKCGRVARGAFRAMRTHYSPYMRECHHCDELTEPVPHRLLNAGELSDSFAPNISAQVSLRLIEIFRRQNEHTLLLLTKAGEACRDYLRGVEPSPQVILSFSTGDFTLGSGGMEIAPYPGNIYIRGLIADGWRVRLRYDPLLPRTLTLRILHCEPRCERITLGTLRATNPGHRVMGGGNDVQRALAALLTRQPNGGSHPWRLPFEERAAIYRQAFDDLAGLTPEIGLCKETPAIYEALGLDPAANRCNCML